MLRSKRNFDQLTPSQAMTRLRYCAPKSPSHLEERFLMLWNHTLTAWPENSASLLSHFMNLSKISASLFLCGIMLGLTPSYHCVAQEDFARGMVVYSSTLTEGPEYHKAALYSGYRVVAAWLDFDVGQKQPLHVESGLVVKIIDFNVLNQYGNAVPVFRMDITSDQDIRSITELKGTLIAASKRSPKLTATVNATCDALDQQITEYKTGMVRIGGRWIERSAMKVVQSTKASSINVEGREYRGARLMSAKEGVVTLAHDGGIARVTLSALSDAARSRLAAAFQLDLTKVGTAAVSSPSIPSSPTPTTITPSTSPTLVLAKPAVLQINAQGSGTSGDEALRDALRDAVRRAVGTFISTEQVVKNDEIIRDQVVAHSDAFVQGYDKISEKHDAELFQVSISARVVRSKLAERLAANGLIGKTELQGENMFAEALTKLDKANSAKELLTKLFTGFPHAFCRPQLIGKPAITGQTETSATMRLRVRVGVDAQAYATWYQQAVTILGQVCQRKKPFFIPRVELEDPSRFREAFNGKLYDETPATANDDPEIARFNPRLDGLVPVLLWNDLGLEPPRVGIKICVSRTMTGFNGDAYDLGVDEASAVLSVLKSARKSGEDAWRRLDKINVAFLNAAGENVRTGVLDLGSREIQRNGEWLAPYGALYGDGDEKQKIASRPPYEDERSILIQPAFVLDEEIFQTYYRKIWDSAGLATAGVAFDFVLEVPLEEIRGFQRLELSWPQE